MSRHPDCAVCGLPIDDARGHNAMPVRAGRCCDQCDDEVVLVTRLVLLGVNPRLAKRAGRELYTIKFKEKLRAETLTMRVGLRQRLRPARHLGVE